LEEEVVSIEEMKQALEDVRFAREALAGSCLRSCDGHLKALVQFLTQAIEQAEKQQIESAVREAIDEFGQERFAKAHTTPVREPVATYSDIVSDGGFDPRNKFDEPAAQREWAELMTDRERSVVLFALHRFMHEAYGLANEALQDKRGLRFKPGAADAFHQGAHDAGEIISKLRKNNVDAK
jgi:hypothetical protein